MRILMIMFFLVMILSSGCSDVAKDLPNPYYCEKDSDCSVKDVHNCCGYYPRCVNIAYPPNITAVEEECRQKQQMSICGFPDVTGCRCVENECKSLQADQVV